MLETSSSNPDHTTQMPDRIPHPCSKCRVAITHARMCDDCTRETNTRYEALRRERDAEILKLYKSARFQKERAVFLQKNPICNDCKKAIAIHLDHKTAIKKGTTTRARQILFWDKKNWQGLCVPCHSSKSAKEGSRWGSLGSRSN